MLFISNLRALGSAPLSSLWSAHRRVNVHLGPPPHCESAFFLESNVRCLIWPLCLARPRATDWRVIPWCRSFFSPAPARALTLSCKCGDRPAVYHPTVHAEGLSAVALICAITRWAARPSSTMLQRAIVWRTIPRNPAFFFQAVQQVYDSRLLDA